MTIPKYMHDDMSAFEAFLAGQDKPKVTLLDTKAVNNVLIIEAIESLLLDSRGSSQSVMSIADQAERFETLVSQLDLSLIKHSLIELVKKAA